MKILGKKKELAPRRIAVAIPTHDTVPVLFAYDWAALAAFTVASMPGSVEFGQHMVTGTYVHSARNDLMQVALSQGCDFVLWLDSDMRFPRDALLRLLAHKKEMVGINYAKRGVPSGFVAIKRIGAGEVGYTLPTTEESTGLEEVEGIGFGCVLIRSSALEKMPDPSVTPWFQNVHLGGNRWMGEDIHFCTLLRQTGVPIYVDHDLSKACAHIGQFEYRLEHAALELPEKAKEAEPEPEMEGAAD